MEGGIIVSTIRGRGLHQMQSMSRAKSWPLVQLLQRICRWHNTPMRDWIARKLLRLAVWIDPGTRFVFQAGEFKFERHRKQPVSKTDLAETR